VIRLLIVDDSALMRKLLGGIFSAEGDFEIRLARNGVEALAEMRDFQPQVVTLDINMPEMDGLTCLDRIMVEQPCAVVMLSSLTEDGADATLEALRLGAVDFVAKPSGAVSLAIDQLAPLLVEKVRTAAGARIKRSLRLTERVRLRAGSTRTRVVPSAAPATSPARPEPLATEASGALDGMVLVGTSTGGPPALEAVLSALPEGFAWPVLVAQHMPSTFTGTLARRLNKLCALEVVEVSRPTPILAGHVYIGRGDADIVVSIRAGAAVVMSAPARPDYPWHPSVDRLVTSALEQVGAGSLIGVLMTGMGRDGAEAMTRLRGEGGRTIAEAEETAIVWGMPGELVKAGGAEFVVPLDGIADRVVAIVDEAARAAGAARRLRSGAN
jgi:two-component system chemotaxis response regulator CheB